MADPDAATVNPLFAEAFAEYVSEMYELLEIVREAYEVVGPPPLQRLESMLEGAFISGYALGIKRAGSGRR